MAFDWHRFLHLARFHRVQGLVWNTLSAKVEVLPHDVANALQADARYIAASNLRIAVEAKALQSDFADARVPLLFIKGLTVGALAYRSPMLKMGWDIDLLIDPGDVLEAAQLLESRGFTLRLPAERKDLQSWHGWSKESVWRRADNVHIELHTSLADHRALIPTIDVHSPTQLVEVAPGNRLATLADEELFAYLSVHGASSAWFRLKWIADFAGFLSGRPADDIERLYRRSQQLGAGRAPGQALLLADRLFDTLNDAPSLRTELKDDPTYRRLAEVAMRMLGRSVDPTERRFGTLPIHWSQFLLLPSLRYKASELRRQAAGLLKERLV